MSLFTIQNRPDVTTDNEAKLFQSDIDMLIANADALTGVQGVGGVVSAQGVPNMSVAVTAGTGRYRGRKFTWAANTSLTIATSHVTFPRFDVVYVNTSGTVGVVTGAMTSANAVEPNLPTNAIPLARVYVPAGSSTVVTGRIQARRIPIQDPGFENGLWYGMVGDDSTDNSAAMTAMIQSLPTTGTQLGRLLFIPAGIYRFNSAIDLVTLGANRWTFHMMGMSLSNSAFASGGVASMGTLFRLTAGFTLFDFNKSAIGGSNWNAGPTFQNITFDGMSIAGTRAIRFVRVNRAHLDACGFINLMVSAVDVDGDGVAVPGGDSSWHNFRWCQTYGCPIAFDLKTAGTALWGCGIINPVGGTGVKIQGSLVEIYGCLIDSGSIGVDIVGGQHHKIVGTKFEKTTTGIRVRESGTTGSFNGDKNVFIANSHGNNTNCYDIGTGCQRNFIIAPVMDANAGPAWVFADATARLNTIVMSDMIGDVSNLMLGSNVNFQTADANMSNSSFHLFLSAPTGGACVSWKTKDASGVTRAGPQIYSGSGSPNGVVTASPGALYTNTAGGATNTLWVKESTNGNTGWVAK